MKAKLVIALLTLAAGLPLSANAADDHSGHSMSMRSDQAQAPTNAPLIEGLVKKVDKAAGKLTISHGPLPNGMPAMTMAFRLKEAAWIDQVKEGDKIRFASEQINGAMTLVRFERMQ